MGATLPGAQRAGPPAGTGAAPARGGAIFVLLKVAPRPDGVYFSASRGVVDASGAPREVGDCDRRALEAAVRLAEAAGAAAGGAVARKAAAAGGGAAADACAPGPPVEVAALSWAPEADEPVLRVALAAGASSLLRIATPLGPEAADPAVVAAGLAEALAGRQPRLVLCGQGSPDESRGAVGPMVAALLGWPLVCGMVRAAWGKGDGEGAGQVLEVEAEEGSSLVLYRVRPPAVLAVGRHGPAPRTPSPVRLARAFRQPVERLEVSIRAPALKLRSLGTTESRRRLGEPIPGAPAEALAMLWARLRERRVV
ncbi:MAG: hypothetical protein K6T75_02555 [Acetobacteraceae bacterium]|nr:hypothetical protein [Acetobacteraceae bacterium]